MGDTRKARFGSLRALLFVAVGLFGYFYGRYIFPVGASVQSTSPTTRLATFSAARMGDKLGFQEKAGMVPPRYTLKSFAMERKKFYESWFFNYIHHDVRRHSVVPFPQCQVYINHHYKFIWIKGHKVGSTALREPLGWLCDDGWKIPANASFDYCSKALWKQEVTPDEAAQYWKEYFVFGVVRNPYHRFASAYEYVKTGNMSAHCNREIRGLTFKDVCEDPYLDAAVCYLGGCWCAEHHHRHFMPQAPCLLTESLLPAVDYLAEVSTLDSDLEMILEAINKRRNKELPPLVMNRDLARVNTHKPTARRLQSNTPSYISELYQQFPSCVNSVGHYFHQDFLFFGYEKWR